MTKKLTRDELLQRLFSAESTLDEAENALKAVLILEDAGKTRNSPQWNEAMLSVRIANKCCDMHKRNYSEEIK